MTLVCGLWHYRNCVVRVVKEQNELQIRKLQVDFFAILNNRYGKNYNHLFCSLQCRHKAPQEVYVMKLNPQASSSSQVVARAKKIRCIGPWRKFLLPFFHVARFLPPFRKSIWRSSSSTENSCWANATYSALNKHNVSNCPVNCGGERR